MAEKANITPIGNVEAFDTSDTRPDMVRVEHVSMVFNMASEQLNNLKEYAIALARRELMFKEFRALDDVSLSVKKGDVFGIMGTNGSGKSTLLKIIAGVLDPTEGTVQINGNIAPLIELGAGFDMDLTARENIYLNGALLGYPKKFIAQHFDEIVDFAEIRQFLDMPLKNYSSGMVARIAFAIATVIVPDILIVDEVLSVGDFMFQQKCERRIQSLIKEHGVTVLIVSHNESQIERLCNKAIWIEKGHTRMISTAKEVCEVYRILGGRESSPEAEARVVEMLQDPTPVDQSLLQTFAGDDRYGTASKLFGEANGPEQRAVIVAPGEDASVCMIANAFASTLRCGVLLTKCDSVPDLLEYTLQQHKLEKIYIMGGSAFISDKTADAIAGITGAALQIINGNSLQALTAATYQAGTQTNEGWGRTAIITYDGCTGDLLSLLPFIFSQRCPLFFSDGPGRIGDETLDILISGAFDRLLVLGGQTSFPDTCIAPLIKAGLEIVRFCGENAYHANRLINEWMAAHSSITTAELVISSVWNPSDGFAVGPYLGIHQAALLLEDTQNLNSVANAFDFIAENASTIQRLTFLGGNDRFTTQDKELLAKVLARTKTQQT